MALIHLFQPFDPDDFRSPIVGAPLVATATTCVYASAAGYHVRVTGADFAYADGVLTGGTFTLIEVFADAALSTPVATLDVGAPSWPVAPYLTQTGPHWFDGDSIHGSPGVDTLDLSQGDVPTTIVLNADGTIDAHSPLVGNVSSIERFIFGAGSDWLADNAASDDWVDAGAHQDRLYDGDILSYRDATMPVSVDLEEGTSVGTGIGTNTVLNFEIVHAGDAADVIRGSDGQNVLSGNGGDDFVDARAGDDIVTGDDGDDEVRGGDGNDLFEGGTGNDVLHGGPGDDDGWGNEGDDTIRGDEGDDVLAGNEGADDIDGGTGSDTASYVSSSAGVVVSLLTSTANGGDATGDTLISIENLTGSRNHADFLTGSAGANTLDGQGGNDALNGSLGDDHLLGGDGDDNLTGSGGADRLDGGGGIDTANYSNSDARVIVNLISGFTSGGHATGDTFSGVESLFGSGFADRFTGDGAENTLNGWQGDDTLIGGDGADLLLGGLGGDRLEGGAGDDVLSGYTGADVLVYADAAFGRDTIIGFEDGIDLFDMSGAGLGFADFTATAAGPGTRLTLTADPAHSILILGVAPGLIDAADFV